MQIERNVVSDVDASLFCGIGAFVCLPVLDIPITLFRCIRTQQNTRTHTSYRIGLKCSNAKQKPNVLVNNFHLTLRLKLTHRIRAPIVQTYTSNHISDMESELYCISFQLIHILAGWLDLCILVERLTFYIHYVDDKL